MIKQPSITKLSALSLQISRWMALFCAYGIAWSNACFNIGFYLMMIFFALTLVFETIETRQALWLQSRWKTTLKTPAVIIALSLFTLISIETIFTNSSPDLAKYDFIHYRKLLAIPVFIYLFDSEKHQKQLLISYCLGAATLMLPTLLDGFGIADFFHLNLVPRRNAAYSPSMNGVHNLVYWRNQIIHGFNISVLFSVALLGSIYAKKYRWALMALCALCMIDLLFFIYGRMALISLIVALVVVALQSLPTKKHIVLFLTALSLAAGIAYVKLPSINTRVNAATHEASAFENNNNITTSGGQRLHYWQVSWQLFKQSPVIGNGSGSFRQQLVTSDDPLARLGHRHTHNEYLTQLAQYGLIGFSLVMALIYITIKNARQIENRWLSSSICTAVIIFATNALTDSSLHNNWEGWAFVLFTAIAAIKTTQTQKLSRA